MCVSLDLNDCVNYGNISHDDKGSELYIGGFISHIFYVEETVTINVVNCTNSYAGSSLGCIENVKSSMITISDFINEGDFELTSLGVSRVGGVIAQHIPF